MEISADDADKNTSIKKLVLIGRGAVLQHFNAANDQMIHLREKLKLEPKNIGMKADKMVSDSFNHKKFKVYQWIWHLSSDYCSPEDEAKITTRLSEFYKG